MLTITILTGLAAMFFWGINAIFEKRAAVLAGPIKPVFYINLLSFILGIPLIWLEPNLPHLNLEFFILLFILAAFDFAGFLLFYRAFSISKVSLITPITSSYAVLTTIISVLFFNEPITLIQIAIIFYIVLGIIILSIKFDGTHYAKKELKGIIYAILIFIIYGSWVPFWNDFITRGNIFFILTLERLILIFFSLFFVKFNKSDFKITKPMFLLFLISDILLLIGNSFYNWGLAKSDYTSLLSAIASAYPLVAVISAYIFLKEKLKTQQYLGIAIIISGIVMLAL